MANEVVTPELVGETIEIEADVKERTRIDNTYDSKAAGKEIYNTMKGIRDEISKKIHSKSKFNYKEHAKTVHAVVDSIPNNEVYLVPKKHSNGTSTN